MSKPKISVIISCFNCEAYLESCLDALKNQTLKEIEVICINDSSTDKTGEIINNYAKSDKRFKVINNKKNLGVSKSRNLGLKAAEADFIMFCDGDDYYESTTCETMLDAIKKSGADLAINEIRVIYEAHSEMKYSDDNYYSLKFSGLEEINDDVVQNTDLSPTNKIFRKALLDKNKLTFPENLHFEDAYFCTAYLFSSNSIYYVNENLYNYVRHENSIMSDTWSKNDKKDIAIEHLYIAFELFKFLQNKKLLNKHNETFWKLFYAFELFALDNSKRFAKKIEIRKIAKEFYLKNKQYLDKASRGTRQKIITLNSFISYIRPKNVRARIVRYMPIYRIQVYNVRRLQKLKQTTGKLDEKLANLERKIG